MTEILILPGIGGSGPAHWQTLWEQEHPEYRRIQMPDWDRPLLDVWLEQIDQAVGHDAQGKVVVAHSLGCLAVAHWARRGGRARAALLVAVPDPDGPLYPQEAHGFAPVPLAPLGFSSLVVASRDDPYACFEHAERCAAAWGSELCDMGRVGHINAESGLGAWEAGQQLLRRLLA
jgi:predicted alpha/beta hydrolase family esterase